MDLKYLESKSQILYIVKSGIFIKRAQNKVWA